MAGSLIFMAELKVIQPYRLGHLYQVRYVFVSLQFTNVKTPYPKMEPSFCD